MYWTELHLPIGWNGTSAQQCAVAVYDRKWLPHLSEIKKCFRTTGSSALSENLARKPQLNAYHLKKCMNKPQTPALSPSPKPHHKFLMFTSGLDLSFLLGFFCGIWGFGSFSLLLFAFLTQNTSFLLLNTDLQTANHLLHHEGHVLIYISSTSDNISSSHCSLLGATHSTVRVLILTHAWPAERLRRGSCRTSCHNKTRTQIKHT